MNDRHPSGITTTPAPASDAASARHASYGHQEASYGDHTLYDGYGTTGFDTSHHATVTTDTGFTTTTFETDPLFGDLPGSDTTGSYDSSSYDTSQWSPGSHRAPNHEDPYVAHHQAAFDTGGYDSSGWTAGYQHLGQIPAQSSSPEATSQWDPHGWPQAEQPGQASQLGQLDQTQQWTGAQLFDTGTYDDTGAYDAPQWNSDGTQTSSAHDLTGHDPSAHDPSGHDPSSEEEEVAPAAPLAADAVGSGRVASRAAPRSRRRTPAKRSAVLTVAVPSACVMGVAGIAAATVGGGDDDSRTLASAPDATVIKPSAANNKLDTQLESLSEGADDFADRASRTQERLDLKAQQKAEKKRAAAEAARKERLRPKFALPVSQHGLSAYYGQSGINWMSLHTGVDFPVSYGTPVKAATDGTVRTQWNSAYGNMIILTAKDGTETWYCHLSTYKVASGTTVKAGEVIAYSGNSGNSTGPHLHFEVRLGGGSATDPLPWLRSHGLDPA